MTTVNPYAPPTARVKYRTSIVVWIVLGLLVLAVAVILLASLNR